MPRVLALDFGGTKHTASLVEWPLDPLAPTAWQALERACAPPDSNSQIDLAIMLDLARRTLGNAPPAVVGVSFGGPVDAATGIVKRSHHVVGWEAIDLRRRLQTEFGCPVWVDNDANVAAFGEAHIGAGQGCSSLVYMTVSTGVGGGIILDGKIWHGLDSMAGEIGHMTIDPNGPVCLCGKRGCVERFSSGRYMAEDARQSLLDEPTTNSLLSELADGDPARITGQMVGRAAELGDPLAQELLDRAAWALGVGIGNLANLLNPQRFILGGGVTKSGERFWGQVRQTARQVALPEVSLDIQPASLGDDAPLWGAVLLAGRCL